MGDKKINQKILVVSDNHGSMQNLKYVLDTYKEKIDACIHCGDSEYPPVVLEGMLDCPVYMAEGNCDYDFNRDSDAIFEWGDHICFVTHGHRYGVNWGEDDLVEKALEMGADLVFYGHTHCPAYHIYEEEGVTVFNPGSISLPRQNPPRASFLIVEMQKDGKVTPHFYGL